MFSKKDKKQLPPPSEDPSSIGNIIVGLGILSKDLFQEFIREFQELEIEILLGRFLVEKEVLTEEQLELALLTQKKMRSNGRIKHELLFEAMEAMDKVQQSTAKHRVERLRAVARVATMKVNGD